MKTNPTIYLLFSLIVLLLTEKVFSQVIDVTKMTDADREWSEGTITLTSGEKIKGLLKLNTRTGLLAYENGATSRSFTPRNVLLFEYFDEVLKQKRSFISVTYKADPAGKKKGKGSASENGAPQFYEILIECKTFALLSSIGRMDVTTKAGTTYTGVPASNNFFSQPSGNLDPNQITTTYSQVESLFLFDADGNITPLVDITHKEIDGTFYDRQKTKSKKLDSNAIENYTAPHFEKLEEYAREQKLSFKQKDDLIKILDYYKLIAEQ
jgi:hypothetical protein